MAEQLEPGIFRAVDIDAVELRRLDQRGDDGPVGAAFVAAGRRKGARTLVYANFRNRYWKPALVSLGLPYVAPHSARHLFISTLQARGVEVGLVAKLAGHANAAITLTHYTQAVRGGASAVAMLEGAYTG